MDSHSQTLFTLPAFLGPELHLQDFWTVDELVESEPLSPLRVGHFAVILNTEEHETSQIISQQW